MRTGASSRTNRTTRSRSRPRSQRGTLGRVFSSQFPDDNSVYHHDHDHDSGSDSDSDEDTVDEKERGAAERREAAEEASSSSDSDDKSDSSPDDLDEISSAEEGTTIEGIKGGIPYEEDIEGRPAHQLEKRKSARSARSIKDPNLVTWDSPDDPANPKNWSMRRKWAAVGIVSCFTLVSPISSSMISPALASISEDFGITQQVQAQLTLSIFVLAYAIGPLFLGPLSEVYGRVIVLQLSNLFYLAWNLGCGFAQNKAQLMVFRFFSGLGGSAPLAIGGVSSVSVSQWCQLFVF